MPRHAFQVLPEQKIRVIISADAKNEIDDQYAIAYALLSPKIEVVGIAAAHFVIHRLPDSMERSYQEIECVLEKMGLLGQIPVLRGAPQNLAHENEPIDSEAARFFIKQAHTPGQPLYVLSTGAITDMASAYLLDPTISSGIEAAVWLGGNAFPEGGSEFNLANDVAAANVIMDSDLKFWLIPVNASIAMSVSYAEVVHRIKPCGAIGEYLTEITLAKGTQEIGPHEENRILWDIAGVSVVLNPNLHRHHDINAPRFGEDMRYVAMNREHAIRVYDTIDARFTLEDLYAKYALFARN
ncbi:MAG TPA: nucleoside hydrolase [Clostridiales bacterium]|nr:nucleoside hydrolase [Clostridiales bacterium]